MATLGPWDTIFGIDLAAMNALLAQVHSLMPNLVDLDWPVDSKGIASIGIHFSDSPQLMSTGGPLQVIIPVTIETVGASPASYSGEVTANISLAAPNNMFAGSISNLSIALQPANPMLQTVLDNGAVEPLTELLATQLIQPLQFAIPLPPGQYLPADFGACGLDNDLVFLCYTAPQSFPHTDCDAHWPKGVAFLALTEAHITAVANKLIGPISGQGGDDVFNFRWTFGLSSQIQVKLAQLGSPPQIQFYASTDASVTSHLGASPVDFRVPVVTEFTATANFAAVTGPGGPALMLTIGSFTTTDCGVDMSDTPLIGGSAQFVATSLNENVFTAIEQALRRATGTLFTMAPQSLTFPGQPPVTLSFTNPSVQIFPGPEGTSLVALTAQPALAFSSSQSPPANRSGLPTDAPLARKMPYAVERWK